ncbi:hypothetical protein GTW25_07605 [Aliihoeflea aestuarii]|jgi:hypothetical protein|uniref:hypothetical protein n=1 Tax=Aliihoeflea aestuarii TaxID=453840 RepID=UPI002093AA57|nr:hypothetical protein [Aliihoeflea aestuarii]MCO6390891.1 hypothetical protein [Aliihoeflea aestuarii]
MKRIIGLTTAALMSASMLAGPALAQQSPVAPGAGDGTEVETGVTGGTDTMEAPMGEAPAGATTLPAEVDTDATAAIGGEATFDGALAAIEGNATSTAAIDTMTEVGSVDVVRIGELEGADMTALETATSERSAEITELQAALEANTAVSSALEAEDVAVADVVAAETAADGELVVYVQ